MGIWAKLAIGLLCLVGVGGGGFYVGYKFESAEYLAYKDGVDQATTKAVELAKADQAKRDAITLAAAQDHLKRDEAIIANFRPLIERVPVYVTAKDDAACVVPNGFVSLWDTASTQANSGADGVAAVEPDGRRSDVVLSEIAALHVDDAQKFARLKEQYYALRDWVTAQVAANGKIASNPPDQGTMAAVPTESSVAGPIVAQISTPYFPETGQ